MNNDNLNKKLSDLLSSASDSTKKDIAKILKSPQAQKLAGNISAQDKEKLVEKFLNMSNNEIKNKIKNTNISGMSKMSADEILKKLR